MSALLVAPLLLFLMVTFVLPVAALLGQGVQDRVVGPVLPRTIAALRHWEGTAPPPQAAFAALADDLLAARAAGTLAPAASRLNLDIAGMRTTLMTSARALAAFPDEAPEAVLRRADPAWDDIETWAAIRRAGGPLTDFFLLAALDRKRDAAGMIRPVPEEQAVFIGVFRRSFAIAASVTALCLALALPLAALLARLQRRLAGLFMIAVLLPFWTGVIVRTAAWMALLAQQGPLNHALLALHLIAAPMPLLFTRFAVMVAMVHILLPFAVLPIYTVIRQLPAVQMQAAASLGAGPLRAALRVWLPQALPGIGAGGLMVFIQALGFYVTPALLGGGGDQMLPYEIGFYATRTLNWGLAAALSILLLLTVAVLATVWVRIVGLGLVRLA